MSATVTRKAAQIGCAFPYGGRSYAEGSLCIIASSRQPFEEGTLLSAFYMCGTQGLQVSNCIPLCHSDSESGSGNVILGHVTLGLSCPHHQTLLPEALYP